MARGDQVWLMFDQVAYRLHMAVAFDVVTKDQAVAQDTGVHIGKLKKSITGKGDPRPIDRDKQRHLIFGVTRGMGDLEIVLLPLKALAVPERLGDLKRLSQRATQIVAARVL